MNSTSKTEESYEKLRAWYLARLRSAALDVKSSGITPLGLISKDRAWVEKIVLDAAEHTVAAGNERDLPATNDMLLQPVLSIICVCICVVFCAVLTLLSCGFYLMPEVRSFAVAAAMPAVVLSAGFLLLSQFRHRRLVTNLVADMAYALREKQPDNRKLLADSRALWKKFERSVEESKIREWLIADSALELLISFDEELCVVAVNRYINVLTGLSPLELIQSPLLNLIVPEDFHLTFKAFECARREKTAISFESRLFTRQRTAVDVEWLVEWSATESNYFAIGRDISARKTIERVKRESVAMLGHDIKIPLTSISCNLSLLNSGIYGQMPEACAESVQRVERSTGRLIGLINELLEFEKLSNGKMPLKIETVDVDELIARSIEETKGQSSAKEVSVVTQPSGVKVEADADKLLRLVVNLLSNAIKYSPANACVYVSVKGNEEFVEVRVRDEGRGIAAEYHAIIFERYERVPEDGSGAMEGTGLGLAICKAIVESHGGLIGVESKQDEGSTFWFTLPTYARSHQLKLSNQDGGTSL